MFFRKPKPESVATAATPFAPMPPEKTEFYSPFGGFWTDLKQGPQMLKGKRELDWLTDEEAGWLDFWMQNGFVVLQQAVPENLIDAVLVDIAKVIEDPHDHAKVSYWEGGKKHFETVTAQRMAQDEAKLLDVHMLSEAAREAIFAPTVLRFLNLVFERRPAAFQSLTFEYGSQQPVHCDVAFVRVSSPREFVASWIALEDIEAGTGELEYFPGSHRLDDLLFGGASPWAGGDMSDYNERLIGKAQSHGLNLQRFTPRKGDVLLWNAGLYHGGSKCTGARRTRKSLVTHYCPADRYPMYSADTRQPVFATPHGGDVTGGVVSRLLSV